jgi:hypothetical protein
MREKMQKQTVCYGRDLECTVPPSGQSIQYVCWFKLKYNREIAFWPMPLSNSILPGLGKRNKWTTVKTFVLLLHSEKNPLNLQVSQ